MATYGNKSGWAPWGSRRGMGLLAAVGVGAALVLMVLGIALIAMSHKGGVAITVIGAVGLAFWAVMVPLARRRNKV
ncbi:hypothetical protein [Streptomyces sp. NBC_01198]|uniref:hypothetical protein n=1 Tax=Streptomyces sp. NBC_01198 TaxID=2903769 RepID=UPI002E15CAC5|nr:hypothetical protein OG702_34760 [Streptomyces sp. NBC_01198]